MTAFSGLWRVRLDAHQRFDAAGLLSKNCATCFLALGLQLSGFLPPALRDGGGFRHLLAIYRSSAFGFRISGPLRTALPPDLFGLIRLAGLSY
jgi:hypothetical protein